MRVNQPGSNPATSAGETTGAKRTGKASAPAEAKEGRGAHAAAAPARGDSAAEISPKAKEFATAKAVATAAPDTRDEKIAELKRRIAEGRYHVDNDAVADRMVDDHVSMHGIG